MKIARIIILFVVEEEGERDTFFYLKKGIIGVLSLSLVIGVREYIWGSDVASP